MRISKYKNTFGTGYKPNWSEVFVIKKNKNTVPWSFVIEDLGMLEQFMKNNCKKTNQTEFRIEKVIQKKW